MNSLNDLTFETSVDHIRLNASLTIRLVNLDETESAPASNDLEIDFDSGQNLDTR